MIRYRFPLRMALIAGAALGTFVQRSDAQITVSQQEIEAVLSPGKTVSVYLDTTTTLLDVGEIGGPRVYDFSTLPFFFAGRETVFAVSAFPRLAPRYSAATAVLRLNDGHGGFVYVNFLINNQRWRYLGQAHLFSDTVEHYRHLTPYGLDAAFPITFGSSSVITFTSVETTYVNGLPVQTASAAVAESLLVDGYGTLILPDRTLSCLRARKKEYQNGDSQVFCYLTSEGVSLIVKSRSDQPPGGSITVQAVFYFFSTTTVNVAVGSGWNVLSLPVSNPIGGDSVLQVYSNSAFPYGFRFQAGYVQSYTMANGPGYWIKSTTAYSEDITGTPLTSLAIPVATGWNMIGSRTAATDTGCVAWSGGAYRTSAFFRYSAGYLVTSSLGLGAGFWVKSGAAGTITLQSCPLGKQPVAAVGRSIEELNTITIRDAAGGVQTLYFGVDAAGEIPVGMYAMPPLPPEGAFDARFESADGGRMVQTHAAEVSEAIELPITIQSSSYPLTVTWKVNGTATVYELRAGEDVVQTLSGEGTLRIGSDAISRLTLRVTGSGSALPKEYALWQNYPNPFNPVTTIRFALPVESKVSAEIYNILGQRVATLVNEVLPAGYHTVEWNGTGSTGQALGSGVYFLKVAAKGANGKAFTDVKKLMMVK